MPTQTTILACDVINEVAKGRSPVSDAEIEINCETCEQAVTLASCSVTFEPSTVYRCKGCGDRLLLIDKPDCGRGYRLGDFVFVNEGDIKFCGVLVPRSD